MTMKQNYVMVTIESIIIAQQSYNKKHYINVYFYSHENHLSQSSATAENHSQRVYPDSIFFSSFRTSHFIFCLMSSTLQNVHSKNQFKLIKPNPKDPFLTFSNAP